MLQTASNCVMLLRMGGIDVDSPRLYSIAAAASLLGISPDSGYRLIAAGALKKVNVGSVRRPRLRISADELARFIAARTS